MRRIPRRRAILIALAAAGLSAALGAGYLAYGRYMAGGGQAQPSTDGPLHISSIFTPLAGEVIALPAPERPGSGGALASWGSELVVLTHEGRIYGIAEDGAYHLTAIEPPANGFAAYEAAAAQPPYDAYEHNPAHFRYNDIAAFELDGRRGLLASFTRYHPKTACYTTALARIDLEAERLKDISASAEDWRTLFETEPCLPLKREWRAIEGHMAGGRMVFDGLRTVYLASGDYHWDGLYGPRSLPGSDEAVSQDWQADYGKVIAIDLETAKSRRLSRGHRNTQGIALDARGRVWVVEHGMRGGDELNLVEQGANFGWPLESYGTLYTALRIPGTLSFGRHERFRRPAIAWLPSIAVSGLTRIENFHEAWDGDLLAATLAGNKLVRIRLAGTRVVFTEFIEIGRRIRYVHQHGDGRIALWTDSHEVIWLTPDKAGPGLTYVQFRLEGLEEESPELAAATERAILRCLECHSLNLGDDRKAPSLAAVYGAQLGATAYSGYSDAMKRDKRIWDGELLAGFLKDPREVVPGTAMPALAPEDPAVIAEIVALLRGLASEPIAPYAYDFRARGPQ